MISEILENHSKLLHELIVICTRSEERIDELVKRLERLEPPQEADGNKYIYVAPIG